MPEHTRKPDQAKSLLDHAKLATPFRSKEGEACASIPASLGTRRTVVPLRSAAFRDWLIAEYYKEFQTAPSPTAFRAALRTLEARARYDDFPTQQVTHRLSLEGDPFLPTKIFLDLANGDGQILEMTSRGWTLTDTNLKTAFLQSSTTLPLPNPQQFPSPQSPAPLTELCKLFRIPTPQLATVLAWLASALRPNGPYPILVLDGPAGSGKSVLARALRALIDPSTVPIHRLPSRARDLLQLALRNWILVFDLVHRVPYNISETLCAISSGDALEITQPDLRDPLMIQIARPMILIAPHDETQPAYAPPRTLANRTLTIHLDHIASPRPEAAIWSAYDALRPAAFASLADAVSTAMRRIRDIDLGNVPRFPDCAAWTMAAAPSLGLDEAAVIGAFAAPGSVWAGSDPLREAMHALLEPEGTWTGETNDLLNQLRARVPFAALPSTPKGLLEALPAIPGVRILRTRNEQGHRTIQIVNISEASHEHATTIRQ